MSSQQPDPDLWSMEYFGACSEVAVVILTLCQMPFVEVLTLLVFVIALGNENHLVGKSMEIDLVNPLLE